MNSQDIKHYFGFYRAKVVDNRDPEKFGRVKVWLPNLFIDIPESEGLWARPANNPIGGRNQDMSSDKLKYYGSLYIPEKESWIWVFFEGGNINNPYYFASLDIENTKVPPENTTGSNYELKWTIIRSKEGRVIHVSDDPDDERVEITGKKSDVTKIFDIDDNQKVILIDERNGKEKILIKDQKGNYINIDTNNNDVHFNSNRDYNNNIERNYNITVKGNVNIKVNGDVVYDIGGNLKFNVGGNFQFKTGGKFDGSVGSSAKLTSGDSLHLSGATAFLTGLSSIDLFSSGIISISGANTSIQNGSTNATNAENLTLPETPTQPNGDRK